MKTLNLKIILFCFFSISSIEVLSQVHPLQTLLGTTKNEFLSWCEEKRSSYNVKFYNSNEDNTTITFKSNDSDIGGKATFYFKNKIIYKVEIEKKIFGFGKLSNLLSAYLNILEQLFYEDKTIEFGSWEWKFKNGDILTYKASENYGERINGKANNNYEKFILGEHEVLTIDNIPKKTRVKPYVKSVYHWFIDSEGNHPYGGLEFSKTMFFTKPGQNISLKYNYGKDKIRKGYYIYNWIPENLSKRKKRKAIKKSIESREYVEGYKINGGDEKLFITIESN